MKTVPPNVELLALAEALESVMPRWVILPQASRLTSTAWNGAARSTTAATKIDMSAVFGTPANIDAVLLRVSCRDSGSATTQAFILLADADPGPDSIVVRAAEINNRWNDAYPVVPTDANGDIYYSCSATGVGTLYIHIVVLGYHLR